MKNIILPCLALVLSLSGCGKQEIAQLRAENKSLKNKINVLVEENTRLVEENTRLKETDQSYYERGVEAYNTAVSKVDFFHAKDIFVQMTEKFPKSSYIQNAKEYIAKGRVKIQKFEAIESNMEKFNSALRSQNFDSANLELKKLKQLISKDTYEELTQRLYEKKNKPLDTTINALVSKFAKLKRAEASKENVNMFMAMIQTGMRVRVPAYFASIDRNRGELSAYSDGGLQGSRIDIYYRGTNMENVFDQRDPDYGRGYLVTGMARLYSQNYTLYIQAEKIELP